MDQWHVCVEHVAAADEDKQNKGGVVICLQRTGGADKQEVSRVGYVRRHSSNPKTKFKEQLQAELDKARTVRDQLNAQLANQGVIQ